MLVEIAAVELDDMGGSADLERMCRKVMRL